MNESFNLSILEFQKVNKILMHYLRSKNLITQYTRILFLLKKKTL